MTRRAVTRRRAAVAVPPLLALLAASCSAGAASGPPDHAPVRTPRTSTTDPPSTTSTTGAVPSATPTTAPAPVAPVPGWSAPLTTLPPGGGFTSVSCISSVFCVAAGGGANDADVLDTSGSGVAVSWDGAAWSDPSVFEPAPASGPVTAPILPAVACTSGPFCLIVDGTDHQSTGDGTNWSLPASTPTAAPLNPNPADPGPGHPASRAAGVACTGPHFCAAVDNTGHAESLVNGNWSGAQSFGFAGYALYQPGLVGISCPSASMCRAVVGTAVLDWDGNTWTAEASPWAPSVPPGSPQAVAVGCPSDQLCAVVSGTGFSVWMPGRRWTPPQTIDPAGGLDSISCPTQSFCMAADEHGSVLQWDGGAWSAPARVIPAASQYTGDPTTVSCPSDRFCMVLNGDGDYATYSGSSQS